MTNETILDDPGSGIDLPTAFLIETVQGEGGLNVASSPWLGRLQGLAARIGAFLIVDQDAFDILEAALAAVVDERRVSAAE